MLLLLELVVYLFLCLFKVLDLFLRPGVVESVHGFDVVQNLDQCTYCCASRMYCPEVLLQSDPNG